MVDRAELSVLSIFVLGEVESILSSHRPQKMRCAFAEMW